MILVMVVEYTLAVVIAFDADENKKKMLFLDETTIGVYEKYVFLFD